MINSGLASEIEAPPSFDVNRERWRIHHAFQLIFLLMLFHRRRRNKPMKQYSYIVLACVLAIPALAQDAKTNVVTESIKPADATVQASGQSFPASAAVLTAPLVLTNDYLHLATAQAELADGGKAVFSFTIANAGNYVIETLVNAPDESTNSFFVNIDAQPVDPDMIWDIQLTTGFEKRLVNWRGNGDSSTDQFTPKNFKLEPGTHTLVIVGREPDVQLKSLTILPAPPEKPASP
jgi:hypothetical protein